MATIIDFKDVSRHARKVSQHVVNDGTAQLLLFTGVRYERQPEAAPESGSRRGCKETGTQDRKTS